MCVLVSVCVCVSLSLCVCALVSVCVCALVSVCALQRHAAALQVEGCVSASLCVCVCVCVCVLLVQHQLLIGSPLYLCNLCFIFIFFNQK